MLDIITYTISVLITAPLLASFIVYIISMLIERNKWKAIHRVVNWTTIFYIIAVLVMLELIFDRSFLSFTIIFFLVILTLIIFIQWKDKKDVQFIKAIKLLTRILFLLFFLLYGCFMIIGILGYLLS